MIFRRFSTFLHSSGGNLTVITALGLTVLTGIAGAAMLFAQGNAEKAHIQGALDAGVLAGTALGFSKTDGQRIAAAEAAFYNNAAGATFGGEDPEAAFEAGGTVKPMFTVANARVSGVATAEAKNSLGTTLGITKISVNVDAQGEKMASEQVCVLALDESNANGLEVYGNAEFKAENCAVQANTDHTGGMRVYGNKASASATQFGVTGGFNGSGFSPRPVTDVEPVEDPYAGLPVPDTGTCVDASSKLTKNSFTLDPGTYCGGLNIKAGATVTLNPGVYIMKAGAFEVNSGATVNGKEVMITLVGANSLLTLKSDAAVTLTSPVSGTYKNIQFMSDRQLSESKFEQEWSTILSGARLEYDGVMYLPEQQFWVSGTSHDAVVKATSPTMTMVAGKIWVQGNAVIDVKREDKRGIGNDIGVASFSYGARLVR
jgi:Flp pilus assembly protein TadG